MIYIIAGGINSGKTSKIKEIYFEQGGDGIVSEKVFHNNVFIGYELLHLLFFARSPLAVISEKMPKDISNTFTFGDFTFFNETFEFAERVINRVLHEKREPIYIDEIGLLELEGRGFSMIFNDIILSNRKVYFTVRDKYLNEVINTFNINVNNLKIIDL